MSWTFIGMLLLVIGLIAANLALLKHGSKKQKIATEKKEQLPPHSAQAAIATAPAVTSDQAAQHPDLAAKATPDTTESSDTSS